MTLIAYYIGAACISMANFIFVLKKPNLFWKAALILVVLIPYFNFYASIILLLIAILKEVVSYYGHISHDKHCHDDLRKVVIKRSRYKQIS